MNLLREGVDLFISFLLVFSPIASLALTGLNIRNLICRKAIGRSIAEWATLIAGSVLTFWLCQGSFSKEWFEPVVLEPDGINLHVPLAGEHTPTFLLLCAVALAGLAVLLLAGRKLPPLLLVLCIAALYLGGGLCVVWIAQLAPNLASNDLFVSIILVYLMLFPLNYLLLAARALLDLLRGYRAQPYTGRSPLLRWLNARLQRAGALPVAALLALIPLLGVCIGVLTLFGQQPDAALRVFTETSDWLFSTKISPPPVEYQGHYLCTVAAGGHRRVVKPLRPGVRHGHPIVVNRQLCIANAFEELIAERTPRFHRFIRHVYDTYGYPLSKHIRTPLAADVTYVLMKPLEWLFLAVLYLCDRCPETRIARQYLPPKTENGEERG